MARTMLVHVNVTIADDDPRTVAQIEDLISGGLCVGMEGAPEAVESMEVTDCEEV